MRYSLMAGGKRLRPDARARGGRSGRARGSRRDEARALARAAGGVRARADSHLLARARRPAGDGQRHAAARAADGARRLRRGHGDPGGRRAADRSVRAARRASRRRSRGPAIAARKLRASRHRRRRRRRAGMVGGQAIDLRRPRPARPARRRRRCATMHARKTGALIRASAAAGAIMAGATARSVAAIDDYAPSSASRFRSSTTSSTSRARRRARQDRRQGRRRRQADLPRALRPGRVAPLADACVDARDRRRSRRRGSADSLAGHRALGRRRERIEKNASPRPAARRARARGVARARARADPRRPGARRRSAASKAGDRGRADAPSRSTTPDHPYVGRGGLKLAHALDAFGIDVAGRSALDIGASTGGFTDVLLQRGAARVVALDVGHGPARLEAAQRSARGRARARQRAHADADDLPGRAPVRIVTIDVSFISLRHILPVVPPLLAPGADVVALVKPQFEAGREEVGKGGIVRDAAVHARVVEDVTAAADALGLTRAGDDRRRSPAWKATGSSSAAPPRSQSLARSRASASSPSTISTRRPACSPSWPAGSSARRRAGLRDRHGGARRPAAGRPTTSRATSCRARAI